MRSAEIRRQIEAFPYWHYRFDLDGCLTPVSDLRCMRQAKKKAYFFDPLVELLGGSLKGKRVLDLGCNAGYWSLCAVEAGCDLVVGIDAHPINIAQASFVFDVKGIARERYVFKRGNVFDIDFLDYGKFDIALCLGLLYHVNQPVALLEKIARANDDLLLIDTNVSKYPGGMLEIKSEHRGSHPTLQSPDADLVLLPTKHAVVLMAQNMGYRAIILRPNSSDGLGMEDYRESERRAFLCSKKTDLSNLAADSEAINPVADLVRLNRDYARRAVARVARWARSRINQQRVKPAH